MLWSGIAEPNRHRTPRQTVRQPVQVEDSGPELPVHFLLPVQKTGGILVAVGVSEELERDRPDSCEET